MTLEEIKLHVKKSKEQLKNNINLHNEEIRQPITKILVEKHNLQRQLEVFRDMNVGLRWDITLNAFCKNAADNIIQKCFEKLFENGLEIELNELDYEYLGFENED